MARRNLRKVRNQVRHAVHGYYDDAKDKIEDVRERSEKTVKEHPFTSIAIAAGVGALVGVGISMLVRERRRPFLDRVRDYW